jgi:predicted glycosyltransferase
VPGSVLFYVQHLLGIGHMRRALRIVEALAQERVNVTLVSGGEPFSELVCQSAERIVQLPPIKARDAGFRELVDADGRPVDDGLRNERRTALLAAFTAAAPDAVLIEAFPFGRRAFRFELDALICAARSRRPKPLVLCSLRDIVVAPQDQKRRHEIIAQVHANFDCVLVHGDPTFIPLDASFPLASEIADRLVYTGYVGGTADGEGVEANGKDEVLVSAGGGAVGGALLSTALEVRRRGCMADLKWRLLTGPNLSEVEFGALANNLPERVVLERFRPDFPRMLRHCRLSISQAGYNTVLDILEAGVTAVVVPFAAERETEQSLRAERLASRGALELVRESELSPEGLAGAIDRALDREPKAVAIDTGGARRTAAVIAEMIRIRANFA